MPNFGPEIVNPVPLQDVGLWVRAMATTYLGDPGSQRTAGWIDRLTRNWDPHRSWGVRDGARWVGTLRTEPRMVSVPGTGDGTRDLRADALTNVSVAATHRRRGLMSRMLTSSLRAARARGDAISILIAAEWPIYGRFGYAPATLSADYVLRRHRAGSTPVIGDSSCVRQVELDEVAQLASTLYADARRRRAGQVDRDAEWWNRILGRDGGAPADGLAQNWFVHDGDGAPDGLLGWKASGAFSFIPPLGAVEVWDLVTASDAAYRDLWSYLVGIDGVDEVRVHNRPVDEPLRWLLPDARTLVMTEQVDFLWLRLLDVPAALAARRYATPGEIVLEVRDEGVFDVASGRYRLSVQGDEVDCHRTERDVDLQITQRALASIYLGGFRPHELGLSGAVVQRTPGALARAALMFSTALAPWNATSF